MLILLRFFLFGLVIFLILRGLKGLLGVPTQRDGRSSNTRSNTQSNTQSNAQSNDSPPPFNNTNSDPYATLGVARGASPQEIKEAYKKSLTQYHPDKVVHLGDDLQELARQRTTEIIKAYEALSSS